MLAIIEGPESSLRTQPELAGGPSHRTLVLELNGAAAPWALARELLGLLAAPDRWEEAAGRHKALLSLALPELLPSLDEPQTLERSQHTGMRVAFLPGAALSFQPLVDAWLDCLSGLLPCGTRIAVPALHRVDVESLALFRPLLRRSSVRWCLGFDPRCPADRPSERYRLAAIRGELVRLQALPGCTTRHLAAEEPADATQPSPVEPADASLAGARRALAAFGFPAAFERACAALEAGCSGRGELSAIAALAGQHMLAAGPQPELLRQTGGLLERALETTSEPHRRMELLYRLCIFRARFQGDPHGALEVGRSLLTASEDRRLDPGRAACYRAWALNAWALPLFRLGCLVEAREACLEAWRLLCERAHTSTLPRVQLQTACCFLLANLSRLAEQLGDRQAAISWQARYEAERATAPRFLRWRPLSHALVHEDLAGEIGRAQERLRWACDELDVMAEAEQAEALADLHFRAGDAAASQDLFARALRLRQRVHEAEPALRAALNLSVAAFRAGDLERAAHGFTGLVASPVADDVGTGLELRAARALLAAAAGDSRRAEQQLAAVLDAAEALGDRGVRVRVLSMAGEAALRAGDPARALARFARARSLLTGASAEDVDAADRLTVLSGLLASGGSLDGAEEAAQLLPEALENPNAWWELPRLLPHIVASVEAGALDLARPQRAWLIRMAGQREDCRDAVHRLALAGRALCSV